MKHVLITGGAGFIGSHVADELLARGYAVRVLDNLSPQVHGPMGGRPEYLASQVELQVGDVRDADAVKRALVGIDAVFHFAAAVGVGQSMYEVAHYTSVNNQGTAVLLEQLTKKPVERLVVASSMSVYGEGTYADSEGIVRPPVERAVERLQRGEWEVQDAEGRVLTPQPTAETKTPDLASVYALSKYDQERLCLILGKAYDMPTTALRFFNVYGPRQALSNPYTGVLAIFASRLLNGRAPLMFEDGQQRRDFVSVHDVARACRLALEEPKAIYEVLNVGSGHARTVEEVARQMSHATGRTIEPERVGKYRKGDVRHCFADISRAQAVLDYLPRISFSAGVEELAGWLETQVAVDRVAEARAELDNRGLTL